MPPLKKVILRCPKILLRPKISGWPESSEGAFPLLQISTAITVKADTWAAPAILVRGAKHVILLLHRVRKNKGITDLNLVTLHTLQVNCRDAVRTKHER